MGFAINRRHFTLTALMGATGTAMATSPKRLLVVGDSISAEYGLTRGSGWVQLLQKNLLWVFVSVLALETGMVTYVWA